MFGRKKRDEEDPFAALKQGGTFESAPTTASDIGLGSGSVQPPPSATLPQQSVTLPPPSVTPSQTSIAAQTPTVAQPSPSPTPSTTTSSIFTEQPKPAPPPPTPRFQPNRQSQRRGLYVLGLPVAVRMLVFGILIVAFGIPIVSSIKSAVHSIKIPSFHFGTTTSDGSSSSPVPQPPKPVNYLRVAGVRSGLARLRRIAPGGSVTLLRLDADSLSVTALRRGHGSKEVYFGPSGTSVTVTSSTGQVPVPISKINPNVIGSLVSQMGRRYHVPARRIDYIVLTSPPGLPAQWVLFTKAPSHPGYSASLSGQGLSPL